MKLEKGRISSLQLTFLIIGFMQGSLFVTTFTYSNTARDDWLIILIAFAVFLPFALISFRLTALFPSDDLLGIQQKVFGGVLGKLIFAVYCLYFLLASAGTIHFSSSFMNNMFMIETPPPAFGFLLLLLCAAATASGLEALCRVGFFTMATVAVCLALFFGLLLNKMEIGHFLPILDMPPQKLLQNTNIMVSEYMGEVFIFSMILPCVDGRKKLRKDLLLGISFGVLALLLAVITITAVLGSVSALSEGPLVETSRQVEIMNIDLRLESLFIGFLVFTHFFRSCVFFYLAVLGISELFNMRAYKPFIIPIGLLIFSLVRLYTESGVTWALAARNALAFISVLLFLLLPGLTLLTALLKGFPQAEQEKGRP